MAHNGGNKLFALQCVNRFLEENTNLPIHTERLLKRLQKAMTTADSVARFFQKEKNLKQVIAWRTSNRWEFQLKNLADLFDYLQCDSTPKAIDDIKSQRSTGNVNSKVETVPLFFLLLKRPGASEEIALDFVKLAVQLKGGIYICKSFFQRLECEFNYGDLRDQVNTIDLQSNIEYWQLRDRLSQDSLVRDVAVEGDPWIPLDKCKKAFRQLTATEHVHKKECFLFYSSDVALLVFRNCVLKIDTPQAIPDKPTPPERIAISDDNPAPDKPTPPERIAISDDNPAPDKPTPPEPITISDDNSSLSINNAAPNKSTKTFKLLPVLVKRPGASEKIAEAFLRRVALQIETGLTDPRKNLQRINCVFNYGDLRDQVNKTDLQSNIKYRLLRDRLSQDSLVQDVAVEGDPWIPLDKRDKAVSQLSSALEHVHKKECWFFYSSDIALLIFRNCVDSDEAEIELNKLWESMSDRLGFMNPLPLKQEFKLDEELTDVKYKCIESKLDTSDEHKKNIVSTLPSNPPHDGADIYESQAEIGNEIFETMFGDDILDTYSDFDFRIVVPPRCTLVQQTEERLVLLLWKKLLPEKVHDQLERYIGATIQRGDSIFQKEKRYNSSENVWNHIDNALDQIRKRVLKANQFIAGHKPSAQYEQLCDDIEEKVRKKKLMLIVHDECHWGADAGSQVDILFNGAPNTRGDDVNVRKSLLQENVWVLHISATPWNYSNVVGIEKKVVSWKKTPPGYLGYEEYKVSDIVVDDDIKNSHDLMLDYAIGLVINSRNDKFKHLKCSESTQRIIEHMVTSEKETDVILIRVGTKGMQEAFTQWLLQWRSIFAEDHPLRRWKIVCLHKV